MSRSVERVEEALRAAGVEPRILACPETARTAAEAAAVAGVEIDQIVKSVIFRGETSGGCVLFLTAGGNRVDPVAAAALTGEPVGRADPEAVRRATGYAIGGVSPVGHPAPLRTWLDPRLLDFGTVWAAAGTPRHIFSIAPETLLRITCATAARFTA